MDAELKLIIGWMHILNKKLYETQIKLTTNNAYKRGECKLIDNICKRIQYAQRNKSGQ